MGYLRMSSCHQLTNVRFDKSVENVAGLAALDRASQIRTGLLHIWEVMQACVTRGCRTEGVLPGGLKVPRRAARLHRQLSSEQELHRVPLGTMDWVNLYALAVNEENAAGGRVVTAPTNGAAGIIPSVLHYYWNFCPGHSEDGVEMKFYRGHIIKSY